MQFRLLKNNVTLIDSIFLYSQHTSSNRSSALFVTNTNEVYGIGNNEYGRLGVGDLQHRNIPTKLHGLSDKIIISIEIGEWTSYALTDRGILYLWGDNYYQICGPEITDHYVVKPTKYEHLENIRQVCVLGFVIALTDNGNVYTWGENLYGQIGNGLTNDKQPLYKVWGYGRVKQVAAGHSHAMLLTEDGEIFSWGNNYNGQLGRLGQKLRPGKIDTLKDIIRISAHSSNSIALDKHGRVFTWGCNLSAQIGNGAKSITNWMPYQIRSVTNRVWDCVCCHSCYVVQTTLGVFVWGSFDGTVYSNPTRVDFKCVEDALIWGTGTTARTFKVMRNSNLFYVRVMKLLEHQVWVDVKLNFQ